MRKFAILIVALAFAGAGVYFYISHMSQSAAQPPAQALYVVPALTQNYSNSVYGFSLMMPADFMSQESDDTDASSSVIALEDTSGNGIQISISPFSEDTGAGYTLTADRIHQDLPDLQISDSQPVTVGPNYTGLAFLSDNPAFGGSSREVWFVFRGNLYQISTYARLDPLLQAIFKTWQFN